MLDYNLLTHSFTKVGIHGSALKGLVSFFHGWGQKVALEEFYHDPLWCVVFPKGQSSL